MKDFLMEMLYALTSAYTREDYDNRKRGIPLETNIGKLFSIFAWGLDIVQEQTELVRLWDDIDNAKGTVLDRYGANFGVKRLSPDDRYYRLSIKVKVMAQLSGGDMDTVIWATASLLGVGASDVLLEEVYPAKIALYVDQELISQELLDIIFLLADAIKRIMAAGVGMRLYLRTYRTFRSEITTKRVSIINSCTRGMPGIRDRVNRFPVKLSQRTVRVTRLEGCPLGVEMIQSDYMTGIQGVYCNTHIKSKRID